MSRTLLKRVGRWVLGATLVATATFGATIPARANDIGSYLSHIFECVLLLGDPVQHGAVCIITPLSGPFASIGSTSSGVYVEPEQEPDMGPPPYDLSEF